MQIIQFISLMAFFVCHAVSSQAQTQNDVYAQLAGPAIRMDSAVVAQLLADASHAPVFVDSDKDGRADVLYIVDTDERHGTLRQPLVVKIIDEDGDMHITRTGDRDSDLYVADWYGDGTVDRIIDYLDTDHDNDVDEQVLYLCDNSERMKKRVSRPDLDTIYLAAWVKDYGDDNRLWYDINYEYQQLTAQWKTDFNGDEMFVYSFLYDYTKHSLTPVFETAFTFYDHDADTYAEETVRFSGTGLTADDVRYSMDIDNDTQGGNVHDYDFSISGIGPITLPEALCQRIDIRGITAEPVIAWEHMREAVKAGRWTQLHLTWDENDNNVDLRPNQLPHERWEGVISHGNEYIRQVGGPSCGPYNKRNEVDLDASGGMQLYYAPADRRWHLYGAEHGWILVDYDYNETVDMTIRMEDQDNDGYFDTWQWDADGDGQFERNVHVPPYEAQILPLDYTTLHEAYMPAFKEINAADQRLIEVLKQALERVEPSFKLDAIEDYWTTSLISFRTDFSLGEKIKNSQEGTRYYQDLIRERYWERLQRSAIAQESWFRVVQSAYDRGDVPGAAQLLEQHQR